MNAKSDASILMSRKRRRNRANFAQKSSNVRVRRLPRGRLGSRRNRANFAQKSSNVRVRRLPRGRLGSLAQSAPVSGTHASIAIDQPPAQQTSEMREMRNAGLRSSHTQHQFEHSV